MPRFLLARGLLYTLPVEDCNPLGGVSRDRKVCVRANGLAVDEHAELISY